MRAGLFSAVIVFCSLSALAQQSNNVSACYSQLLTDKVDFSQHTDLKYALYSLWNSDLYESAQHNGSLEVAGYGNGSYSDSQAKILKEFQIQKRSIDYERDTALHTALLDPQAHEIIKDCLAHLAPKFGAWADVEVENERFVRVILHWTSTDGLPLKVRSQSITGGAVVDDAKSHPSMPIPQETGFIASFFDPEIPSGGAKAFHIQRDDPYSTVYVKFNFSPAISIDDELPPIRPVPERVQYEPVTVKEGSFAHEYRHGFGGNGDWAFTDKIEEITADPTAVFTDVNCNILTNPPHIRLYGANPWWNGINVPGRGVGTREAYCSGFVDQFQGASIGIDVKYQVTGLVAHNIPWTGKNWNK